jgi:omega-6 fatty acid desaturase / acyl-lipid omega-6 desaturase (Delta-12 desaturase)
LQSRLYADADTFSISEKVQVTEHTLYDTYGREFNLPDFTMNDILEAIPAECFNRSAVKGLGYVARDLILITLIGLTAHYAIPQLPNPIFRFVGWMVYGFVQGLVGTGVWVLAHECGHQAFSSSRKLNDFVGWVLHSSLLVPYFSWQISHGKHHKATGHLNKDMVFVPKTLSTLLKRRGHNPTEFNLNEETRTEEEENKLFDIIEDTPIASLITLTIQQLLGWIGYLFLNLSGQKYTDRKRWEVNHFNPASPLFSQHEYNKILLSDLGIILTFTALTLASKTWGFSTVFCFYVLPYFWVNHWLVLITYLQHTDPALPHYRPGAWNFQRGAAATMDRDFGFIGQHIFHDIIEVYTLPILLIPDSRCASFLFSNPFLQWPGSDKGDS